MPSPSPDSHSSPTLRTDAELKPRTLASLERAVEHLRADGSVAFPSETVWGLAACARSTEAVARLRRWKGRRDEQPIALLVSGIDVLEENGFEVTPLSRRLMEACWPGPLTVVLRCSDTFAAGIPRTEDGAIGVRCSSHPIAMALDRVAQEAGLGLLTATSLNHTGAPPAQSEEEARLLCGPGGDAPFVIDAGGMGALGGAPSTVLDLTGDEPVALRWGAIGPAALHALADIELSTDVAGK